MPEVEIPPLRSQYVLYFALDDCFYGAEGKVCEAYLLSGGKNVDHQITFLKSPGDALHKNFLAS